MKNWKGFVITGAASAGKTSVINGLKELGYRVVDEIATEILKEGWHPGKIGREVFQQEILRRQLESEALVEHNADIVFLDRGLLDGAAFYILDNMAIPKSFTDLDLNHYAGAILLEHLGVWADNGIRFEDLDFAKKFEPIVEKIYRDSGLPVIRVPILTVAQRVEFIIAEVQRICPTITRNIGP